MKQLLTIIKKELFGYFNSLSTYIVIAVFLAMSNFFFFRSFFIAGQASMRGYFSLLPWFFLFLIPALTMRLWAEEKKLGTEELLYTWPIKEWQPVIAKFLASWIFVAIILILTLSVPMSITQFGHPDMGVIIASYFGALLLAGSFLAIGSYISSITDNQIIAFILGIAGMFIFFIIGEEYVSSLLPSALAGFLKFISLSDHFASIVRGVVDSRDVIYYASVIALFLYLNNLQLKKRG
jgi:ABC-2 type transport system permease protein